MALMNLLPQTASSMEPVAHKGEEIAFIMEGQVKLYLNDEVLLEIQVIAVKYITIC
ncbi:hypothetical protein I8J38_13130 [Bacillus sp. OA1]|nr:hypothetical protein [Bacillus sp. OA1]